MAAQEERARQNRLRALKQRFPKNLTITPVYNLVYRLLCIQLQPVVYFRTSEARLRRLARICPTRMPPRPPPAPPPHSMFFTLSLPPPTPSVHFFARCLRHRRREGPTPLSAPRVPKQRQLCARPSRLSEIQGQLAPPRRPRRLLRKQMAEHWAARTRTLLPGRRRQRKSGAKCAN